MSQGHLGDRVAALVDGQLGHADRDRVLAHLTRCADCRAEAAEQRALKARLDHLEVRAPGGLEQRLLALPLGYGDRPAAPSRGRAARGPGVPARPAALPVPTSARPATVPGGVPRPVPTGVPAAVPLAPRRRPPAALGALLLLGLGAGVAGTALDGDAGEPRRDPGLPGLLVEHATATTHVPLPDPALVGAAWSTAPGSGGTPSAVTPAAVTPVPGYWGVGTAWPRGSAGVVPVGSTARDR